MVKKHEEEDEEEVPQKKLQPPRNNLGNGVSWLRGPLIGKGGFGSVYLANSKKPKSRHRFFPSIMAVKSAEYSVSGSIQKEKEVFSNLRECSNVLRCFGEETTTSENGEIVYNMMLEYASGGTLANLIKKSNCSGLPESDVRRFTRSILKGLNGIHDCGYVHCDLKPQNILLVSRNCNANCNASSSSNFVVKIGDFGLAKKADERKKRRLEPYLRGTALYLAPEAVADNVQEPPADIWALGCVVLEMLTGKPAWETDPGSSSKDLLQRIGYGHELPKIPSGISKEGKGFLKGCFVRKSMFRWTAEMLLDHPFVAGEEEEEEHIAEIEEVFDIVAVSSVSLLMVTDDDELSSSDYSDECSFTSEEDCSFGSWSEDTEEMSVNFIKRSSKEVATGGQKSERIQSSGILHPPSRPEFSTDNCKK